MLASNREKARKIVEQDHKHQPDKLDCRGLSYGTHFPFCPYSAFAVSSAPKLQRQTGASELQQKTKYHSHPHYPSPHSHHGASCPLKSHDTLH